MNQFEQLPCAHRLGDVIALSVIAADRAQECQAVRIFDSLRNDLKTHLMCKFDGRAYEQGVAPIPVRILDKAAINLEFAEGKAL